MSSCFSFASVRIPKCTSLLSSPERESAFFFFTLSLSLSFVKSKRYHAGIQSVRAYTSYANENFTGSGTFAHNSYMQMYRDIFLVFVCCTRFFHCLFIYACTGAEHSDKVSTILSLAELCQVILSKCIWALRGRPSNFSAIPPTIIHCLFIFVIRSLYRSQGGELFGFIQIAGRKRRAWVSSYGDDQQSYNQSNKFLHFILVLMQLLMQRLTCRALYSHVCFYLHLFFMKPRAKDYRAAGHSHRSLPVYFPS